MAIHQWPASEQPRERLIQHGAEQLSDAELLAIFLRTGVQGCSAVELARYLLQHYGSLANLFSASRDSFCSARGLGPAKYVQLKAVLEMARRYYQEELSDRELLTSAQEAKQFVLAKMKGLEREVFSCIFLDSQHKVICYEEVFQGTINQAPVFPRELARRALALNASAVILAHNHPSGVEEPSRADKQITEVITDTLALLDVRVLDHFVVGYNKVYSFAEHGLI